MEYDPVSLPNLIVPDGRRQAEYNPDEFGHPFPRLYQLEVTNRCNYSCPICPRQQMRRPMRDMAASEAESLLEQMPWLESTELFGFGEPTLNQQLPDIVAACTMRDVRSVVATNAAVITACDLRTLADCGLGVLVIDLDSAEASEYAKVRGPCALKNFDRVMENALAACALKAPRPHVCIQAVVAQQRVNSDNDHGKFLRYWKERGADEVRFKFLDSFRGTSATGGKLMKPCGEVFYGFTVQSSGNVVICDRDWDGEMVMGNVFQQNVMEIWRSDKYRELRRRHLEGRYPALCANCAEGNMENCRWDPRVTVNMFGTDEVTRRRIGL